MKVRQHAHTIVALEKQMSLALLKAREMEEERDTLTQQLTGKKCLRQTLKRDQDLHITSALHTNYKTFEPVKTEGQCEKMSFEMFCELVNARSTIYFTDVANDQPNLFL